jgi:EAL domain-containing protein (putative c-di-GMP-specific phosphodiesterase class I)
MAKLVTKFSITACTRAPFRVLQLESDLRRAVEQKQFCVYYQPIDSLQTGRLAGFEALRRWNHPRRGLVSTAVFIPVAEESGLIVPIGEWVLQQACKQGYLFSHPVPSEGVLHLLAQNAHRNAEPDLPLNSVAADDDIVVSYSM